MSRHDNVCSFDSCIICPSAGGAIVILSIKSLSRVSFLLRVSSSVVEILFLENDQSLQIIASGDTHFGE